MFGIRSDGRRIKGQDPIIHFTSYIMPTRNDAQIFTKQTMDYTTLVKYIKEKHEEGHNLSFMVIVLAAYVRTVAQYPELNRFIANKQIYARNRISVSFVVLKEGRNESLAKVEFDPTDTIFDVERKVETAIQKGRDEKASNLTDKFARVLLGVPGLATLVVALARLLDRYGLLPGIVYDASPFHTSMFITNMASINMRYIYHHLYNFGTTSVFISLGKIERSLQPMPGGKVGYKNELPMGIVTDERIMGGASYARVFGLMRKYLNDPHLLEIAPETINTEVKMRPAREM